MTRKFQGLGKERNYLRWMWATVLLFVGIIVYAAGLLVSSPAALSKTLSDLGEVICSAAIVYIVFDWSNNRHLTALLQETVGQNIQDIMDRLFGRLSTVSRYKCWSDYRWNCWIAAPLAEDIYPDYLYQHMSFAFTHPGMPDEFFIMIGKSNSEDAVEMYAKDERCIMHWDMSFKETSPLNLKEHSSHAMGRILMNGSDVPLSHKKGVEIPGGEGIEYWFKCPERLVADPVSLSFEFVVRKIRSQDGVINIITRALRDIDDAEFRLNVDSSIGAKSTYVYSTEVTPLIEGLGHKTSSVIRAGSGAPLGAIARFKQIIQKGSNIRFEVRY